MPEQQRRTTAAVDTYQIYGYEGDYIFETLKRTKDYYEKETLEKWATLIGRVEIILDIGANLGNHSLYWSKYAKAKKIYAFEPFLPNFENLEWNIRENKLQDVIMPVMKAVGREAGKVVLSEFDPDNFGGTTFQIANENKNDAVDITTVDKFVNEQKIECIDLIKIDTEGFENDVLSGAVNVIKTCRPVIWVEVSQASYQEVLMSFEGKRYTLADVKGFNMLFIPDEKNSKHTAITHNELLNALFTYETKATLYYNNYEIAKNWNRINAQKVSTLQEQLEKRTQELKEAQQQYQTAKEWNQANVEKATALQEQLEKRTQELKDAQHQYQTAKEWNQANVEKATALHEQLEKRTQELKDAQHQYQTAKEWNRQNVEKITILQEEKQKQAQTLKDYKAQQASDQQTIDRLTAGENQMKQQLQTLQALLTEKQIHEQKLQEQLGKFATLASQVARAAPKQVDALDALLQQIQKDREDKEKYACLTTQFIDQGKKSEALLNQLIQHINKLQAQVNYLKNENKMYRAKLDKIKSVWYGRAGIWFYKKSRKVIGHFRAAVKK